MNGSDWLARFSLEAQDLYALITAGRLFLFVVLILASILVGKLVRHGAYFLWRLGLDPGHRLAPMGTLVQVVMIGAIGLGFFKIFVRAAPLASFVLLVATLPLLILLLQRPGRNALAGLLILLRRNFMEGDHIVLDGGQRGVVRQIGLTTTVARTDAGGRLVIPNSRLLDVVLEVARRQAGVPLLLRFPVSGRPSEAVLMKVKKLGLLSPFRAGDSVVNVEYLPDVQELELTVRLPRGQARDAATRELSAKITQVLQGEPEAKGAA